MSPLQFRRPTRFAVGPRRIVRKTTVAEDNLGIRIVSENVDQQAYSAACYSSFRSPHDYCAVPKGSMGTCLAVVGEHTVCFPPEYADCKYGTVDLQAFGRSSVQLWPA